MKVVRDLNETEYDKKSVVTVGTFDGVHSGHGKIIDKLTSVKKSKGLRSVLITFEPHPQIILRNRAKDIKILTTLEEKLELFKDRSIDIVYVINFTKKFSETTAEEFYNRYLIERIGLNDLVLGYDHMFGKNREGNFETLKALSERYDFTVDKVDEYKIDGEPVSSTIIRHLIEEGSLEKVGIMLGRNYSIGGTVIDGKKLGSKLGFPTANIKVDSEYKLIPKSGIYTVEVFIGSEKYNGMMSIGINPTVSEDFKIKLEVNIFNFNKNIYGKKIIINFISYLRDELKFDTIDELKDQLHLDRENSLKIINESVK